VSIAGDLARFVTGTSVDDLPPGALERARMAIASTIASAAMGVDIVSSPGLTGACECTSRRTTSNRIHRSRSSAA
jgi:hypothetical protein